MEVAQAIATIPGEAMISHVNRAWLVGSIVLLTVSGVQRPMAQSPAPAAGVPEDLAAERAARVTALHYDLSFVIPHDRREKVTGRAVMTFSLKDTAGPLALDFEPNASGAVHVLEAGGIRVDPEVRNGHLILPTTALREGLNRITVVFDAGDSPLNRNDDFLYTIFVPARAHEVFPCFDQPDLKAQWTLALDVPDGWQAIANAPDTSRVSANGRTRISFAATQPISTYLFAFAAGRFFVEQAERNQRTFRILHRETDTARVARNRDAIVDLHASAIDWLEQYTGIPYPFGKFDVLLLPAFQFSGMEHPGAIFYGAQGLMLDESATQNQHLDRASTIAHETAHMWFGDLVTMRWFNDVWMKEVFANFMAAKIVSPSFPGIDHDLRFLHAYYPAAYDVDRTAGTNAIRQPLGNLKDAGTLYGAIIYQKAPIVMRQLEAITGADAFRDGIRKYVSAFAFGNASWSELVTILDARTPEDLVSWSHAWVEEAGRPIIRTELSFTDGRIATLVLVQSDPYPRRGLTWTQDVRVALGYGDRVELLPVRMAGARTEVPAARGMSRPLFVLPNGDGLAYGEIHLDTASRTWLLGHLPEIASGLTRGSAWVTLWDALLDGEVTAEAFLDLALNALPREQDPLNIQRVLSYLERAYWTFTPERERVTRAADVERVLSEGLAAASTTSTKGAYFSALRNIATTPATLNRLLRIWRGDEQVAGLPLAEPDFIALAQELAVRAMPEWRTILREQIRRTENADRRARLEFIAPALSSDPSDRDRFFSSLADVNNRRREPWVVDGLRYLHHPLRASTSLKYIQPGLELLQEVQRTGDIFFPKRWMDATLGGHRSPQAARIVDAFVRRLPPTYPERLRRTILSSADDLFRASGLR
jgi:aminopeptidase N